MLKGLKNLFGILFINVIGKKIVIIVVVVVIMVRLIFVDLFKVVLNCFFFL